MNEMLEFFFANIKIVSIYGILSYVNDQNYEAIELLKNVDYLYTFPHLKRFK